MNNKILDALCLVLMEFIIYIDYDDRKKKRDLSRDANDIMIANIAAMDRLAARRWWMVWK